MSHPMRAAALASAVLLLAAGCGSGYGSSSGTKSTSSSGTAHVADSSLGEIIVDGSGHTLYMFEPDSAGKSTCSAQCLQYWPPAKPATKLAGVTGAIGQTKTVTGKPILTVAGHPLYSYVGDHKAGDVKGQKLDLSGGEWYVVDPSGHKIEKKAASSSGGY